MKVVVVVDENERYKEVFEGKKLEARTSGGVVGSYTQKELLTIWAEHDILAQFTKWTYWRYV